MPPENFPSHCETLSCGSHEVEASQRLTGVGLFSPRPLPTRTVALAGVFSMPSFTFSHEQNAGGRQKGMKSVARWKSDLVLGGFDDCSLSWKLLLALAESWQL